MRFLRSLLLFLLVSTTTAAVAQLAPPDSPLKPFNPAPITTSVASALTDLGAWSIEGAERAVWLGDHLAVMTPDVVLVYPASSLSDPPARFSGMAMDIALDPSGNLLAIAGTDEIRVWSLVTGSLEATLPGRGPLAFNATMLAYTDAAHNVRLWDIAARSPQTPLAGHTDIVTALDFSVDSRILASSSLDTTIRLWNVDISEQIGFSRSRRRPPLAVDFSSSGAFLATGAQRGIVRLLNLGVDTERTLANAQRDDVTNIGFNPHSSVMLFTTGASLQVWDTAGSAPSIVLNNPSGIILDALFSPDGAVILTVDAAHVLRVWGVPTP